MRSVGLHVRNCSLLSSVTAEKGFVDVDKGFSKVKRYKANRSRSSCVKIDLVTRERFHKLFFWGVGASPCTCVKTETWGREFELP
jgi:hypothetical protein